MKNKNQVIPEVTTGDLHKSHFILFCDSQKTKTCFVTTTNLDNNPDILEDHFEKLITNFYWEESDESYKLAISLVPHIFLH